MPPLHINPLTYCLCQKLWKVMWKLRNQAKMWGKVQGDTPRNQCWSRKWPYCLCQKLWKVMWKLRNQAKCKVKVQGDASRNQCWFKRLFSGSALVSSANTPSQPCLPLAMGADFHFLISANLCRDNTGLTPTINHLQFNLESWWSLRKNHQLQSARYLEFWITAKSFARSSSCTAKTSDLHDRIDR